MPWKPEDAHGKTHKADTPKRQRQWAHVANDAKAGGASDKSAIRQANQVVATSAHKSRKERS